MTSCSVPNCNISHKNSCVAIFVVPKDKKIEWGKIFGVTSTSGYNNFKFICEEHFAEEDVVYRLDADPSNFVNQMRLRPSAVPKLGRPAYEIPTKYKLSYQELLLDIGYYIPEGLLHSRLDDKIAILRVVESDGPNPLRIQTTATIPCKSLGEDLWAEVFEDGNEVELFRIESWEDVEALVSRLLVQSEEPTVEMRVRSVVDQLSALPGIQDENSQPGANGEFMFFDFIANQLENAIRSEKQPRRYSEGTMSFAEKLFSISPMAYKVLLEHLFLPSLALIEKQSLN